MRSFMMAGLMVAFLGAGASRADAFQAGGFQSGDAKEKKEKIKGSLINEIGGKTIEEWIKDINHKDPGRRAVAISTVMLFGPERAYQALPAILEQLGKPGPLDVSVRVNGATAIGLIIGSSEAPDPRLVRDSVRVLIGLLSDTQTIVKYRAAQALGQIGPEAKSAVPKLLPLLQDRLACETRQAAATTLGLIAVDNEKGPPQFVLERLFLTLRDPAARVRLASVQSLTFLGAPADPIAKNALIRALQPVAHNDSEPTIQIWGHMALMSIEHEITPQRVAPVVKMLAHADVPVRVQATQAVGTIGPKAKAAVPSLVKNLSDRDPHVIMISIWALSRMEDDASFAVPALQKISADTEQPEPIQQAAKEALKQINGKKKK